MMIPTTATIQRVVPTELATIVAVDTDVSELYGDGHTVIQTNGF
jgi:hypothetical protein